MENTLINESFCPMSPESQTPVLLVDVWETASWLVQVTVSPTDTVRLDGENAKPLMLTLFPGGGGGFVELLLSSLQPAIAMAIVRLIRLTK